MGLAWCAFLRSKKVLIIIKPVPFWAICAFYTLILKWPEGQQTKQLRKLIVKQMKITKFSVGLKNSPKIRKIDLKWLKMRPMEVLFLARNIFFPRPYVLRKK